MPSRPFEILLVEDSPGDVWLIREILLQGSTPKNISVVSDGEQAMDYLYRRGKFAVANRPDLILLDLNLPRRNGLEVLQKVKADASMRSITVVVLTTSEAQNDVNTAYELNANCYIVKPVSLDAFTTAIRSIEEFWMLMATLPTTLPPILESESQSEQAASSGAGESDGTGDASSAKQAERRSRRFRYPEKHAPFSVPCCRRASRRTLTARSVDTRRSRYRYR